MTWLVGPRAARREFLNRKVVRKSGADQSRSPLRHGSAGCFIHPMIAASVPEVPMLTQTT